VAPLLQASGDVLAMASPFLKDLMRSTQATSIQVRIGAVTVKDTVVTEGWRLWMSWLAGSPGVDHQVDTFGHICGMALTCSPPVQVEDTTVEQWHKVLGQLYPGERGREGGIMHRLCFNKLSGLCCTVQFSCCTQMSITAPLC
jgi:hypothetical protein